MKITAKAHANIAFIKYWGKADEKLKIPLHGSISVNLSNLFTITTISFSDTHTKDYIEIDGKATDDTRLTAHIDTIRKLATTTKRIRMVSKNNFPSSAGLSSSASGYAAITFAACKALRLSLSEKELSILARQGSGSSCRSIPDGFVEWTSGNSSATSYGVSLYPSDYWDIVDIVVVLSTRQKETPTTIAQTFASTSPFFKTRLLNINKKIQMLKKALKEKDFDTVGRIAEEEALELHAIILTQKPWFCYLLPATLAFIRRIKSYRDSGLAVYFTFNTGANVHVLCRKKDANTIKNLIKKLPYVQKIIENTASRGTYEIKNHLF